MYVRKLAKFFVVDAFRRNSATQVKLHSRSDEHRTKSKRNAQSNFLNNIILSSSRYDEYHKPRVIYSVRKQKDENERELKIKQKKIECKRKPCVYGHEIIEYNTSSLCNKCFFVEKNGYRPNIEVHSYNRLVTKCFFPPVCVECGTSNNIEDEPPRFKGRKNRPLCTSYLTLLDIDSEKGNAGRVTYGKQLPNVPTSYTPSSPLIKDVLSADS